MGAFPGAGAQVYYNEAGEPIGWDYPSSDEDNMHDNPYDDDYFDRYDEDDYDEEDED